MRVETITVVVGIITCVAVSIPALDLVIRRFGLRKRVREFRYRWNKFRGLRNLNPDTGKVYTLEERATHVRQIMHAQGELLPAYREQK